MTVNDSKSNAPQKKLSEMSDAEFLSFLYSERDRENSLNQYQGWNNWALVGAIATVICALYSILKTGVEKICFSNVFYYISIVFAFVLSYRSFALLFIRPRGIDYSKMKTVKEAAPILYLVFVLIYATAMVLVLAIKVSWNTVTWLWSAVLLTHFIAGIAIIINRNRIVPSYYDPCLFPNRNVDFIFNLIVLCLLSFVLSQSIKRIQQVRFGPDLEFAVCFSVLLWLVYFLIKTNVGNKPVKEFDVIIDDYLYKGKSKEYTFNRILINRMGFGVMEACNKELQSIKDDLNMYSAKFEKIKHYKEELNADSVGIEKLKKYDLVAREVVDYLSKTLDHIGVFRSKLAQMLNQVPFAENIEGFKTLTAMLEVTVDRVKKLQEVASEVTSMVQNHIQSYYCRKLGSYCDAKDCAYRNDPWSLKYAIKPWIRRKFGFLKRKKVH